jgi:integrase
MTYHTRTLLFANGERFPILLNAEGAPVHAATVWATAELRNRNRASNTMTNALSALAIFYQFLESNGIDMDTRMDSGELLELGELEEIAGVCRRRSSVSEIPENHCPSHFRKSSSMEQYRQASDSCSCDLVAPAVCGSRLRTMRNHLDWLVRNRLQTVGYAYKSQLTLLLDLTTKAINARIPSTANSNNLHEGLSPEVEDEIFEIVSPTSARNPWKDEHVRRRNNLIFHLLDYLGPRRSEVLGIRIPNINLMKGSLDIVRQADAPDDPRKHQPNAKTLGRRKALSEILQELISEYISKFRDKFDNAHTHDFLFVSNSGDPLSIASVNKIFADLRRKNPGLPSDTTPHAFRRTWNDRFSEEMDSRGVDEKTQIELRCYENGWVYTSKQAAVHTRRHIRIKANEVSLAAQKKLVEKRSKK